MPEPARQPAVPPAGPFITQASVVELQNRVREK